VRGRFERDSFLLVLWGDRQAVFPEQRLLEDLASTVGGSIFFENRKECQEKLLAWLACVA
jgi:hypothetical protein